MAAFMYTIFSIAMHCNLDQDISPCSCAPHEIMPRTLVLNCDGANSFNQVVDALQNKIKRDVDIWLKITYSELKDMETRKFDEMNLNIRNLRLNYDQLRYLPESSFQNLTKLEFLSLSDNDLEQIPKHILSHMPRIGTLDLGNGWIRKLHDDDLLNVKNIRHLILVNNRISLLEKNSIPNTLRYLHLGRNNITSLNGTIRQLNRIEVLFLNDNEIETLDEQLPIGAQKLMMLMVHHNRLTHLPRELETMPYLNSLYFSHNQLHALDGVFRHANYLQDLFIESNLLDRLDHDEFQYCESLEVIEMSHNYLTTLNNSLLPLSNLRSANFSHNLFHEFSLSEIRGLKVLRVIDLSHNRIEKLTGRMENTVETDSFIVEIRLQHNLLKSLDGALMGFNKLRVLDVSHNLLRFISPDDLIGMEELAYLDVSHNYLQTLEETEKTFLPNLEKIDASFNNITKLERDFHGLPNLCVADLSNNRIKSISSELVAKSRCFNHGVLTKLEIYLRENPILCHDNLPELVTRMESQEARIIGVAHCIVPKEELPQSATLFIAPSMPLLPDLLKTANLPTTILKPSPSIVQVLMPATIVIQPQAEPQPTQQNQELQQQAIETETVGIKPNLLDLLTPPPLTTIATTYLPPQQDQPLNVEQPIILPTIEQNSNNITPIDTIFDVTTTQTNNQMSTSPTATTTATTQIQTSTSIIMQLNQSDRDNSVYEKLSQIPQVIVTNSDRSQQFLELAEDPPEVLPHRDPNNGTN